MVSRALAGVPCRCAWHCGSTSAFRAALAAVICMLYIYCPRADGRRGESHVCRTGLIRTSERANMSRSALNDSYMPNMAVMAQLFIKSRALASVDNVAPCPQHDLPLPAPAHRPRGTASLAGACICQTTPVLGPESPDVPRVIIHTLYSILPPHDASTSVPVTVGNTIRRRESDKEFLGNREFPEFQRNSPHPPEVWGPHIPGKGTPNNNKGLSRSIIMIVRY